MDRHDPDRRDVPEADDPTRSSAGDEPIGTGSPAEIESWPSQDATTSDARGADAWPTEPPAAGSGGDLTWPTSAPERHDDTLAQTDAPVPPASHADWPDRPPSEVEAYAAPSTQAAGDETGASGASGAPPVPVTAAHAVPAGEGAIGESTQCPRCGTENRPGLAFCRNCGQRLVAAGVASTVERPGTPEGTMACPRCGTHNRAGVAFCQNCGANLRGTAPGYVPPAVATEAGADARVAERRGAVLGPVVLLIGAIGLITGYLLPFLYGTGSLFERAAGPGGYGVAFWAGYPEVSASLADQAYFGLAGPVPILVLLLVGLAVAGFMRAVPGPAQTVGLGLALLWSVGLIVLFVVVELAANFGGDLVGMLRALTPAGIIFFLASLIVVIGALTRFGRS